MPFTFSHPAAILPFTYLPSKWISLTGLVIGSITPDFEYFLRMKIYSSFSHTWAGMLWFDLPLAFILSLLFHLLVRNSLIENSPNSLRNRLNQFKTFKWTPYLRNNFLVFIISCLVGIASHILWDSFTHANGQMVKSIESLNNIISFAGYTIPIYNILQHASTLVGTLLVLYALFNIPKKSIPTKSKPVSRYWLCIIIITALVVFTKILMGLNFKYWGNLVATAIAGICIALILTPMVIGKKR